MTRRFNPSETICIKSDTLPKPTEKSLKIFVEALIDHEDDERITTKPGRVEFAGKHQGKPVTVILDVTSSITRSLIGDKHLSMSVKSGVDPDSPLELKACVACVGGLPVGDYMANVIHMFHNDALVSTINTLEMAATGATYRPRGWRQDNENLAIWRVLYGELIANRAAWAEDAIQVMPYDPVRDIQEDWIIETPPYNPGYVPDRIRDFIVDLPYDVMMDMVRRVYELNCDLEHDFGAQQRRQLFLNMIERPICVDVRRFIIARLGEDWDAMEPLLRLRDLLEREEPGHEDPDGCLFRATEYAICRIKD